MVRKQKETTMNREEVEKSRSSVAGPSDQDQNPEEDQNLTEKSDNEEEDEDEIVDEEDVTAVKHQAVLKVNHTDFFWVILDECQFVKNPLSTCSRIVKLLRREGLLLVSATPIYNHVRDMTGYIDLMWDHELPFAYHDHLENIPAARFYEDYMWIHIKAGGEWEGITMDRLLSKGEHIQETDEPTPRQLMLAAGYKEALMDGRPLFAMNPHLYRRMINEVTYGPELAQRAIRVILGIVFIRRGLFTPLELPDGSIVRLGDDMPPVNIRTVELQPFPDAKKKMQRFISEIEGNLFVPSPGSLPTHLGAGNLSASGGIMISGNVYRRLNLASTDPKNIILTTPTKRAVKMIMDRDASRQLKAGNLSNLANVFHTPKEKPLASSDIRKDDPATPRKAQISGKVARKHRADAAGGSKETQKVAVQDPTGGLQWLYLMTRDSGAYGFPSDRIGIIRYVVWDAPKYAYVLDRVLEAQQSSKKVLVYVGNPLTSMVVYALLQIAGVRTLHITSRTAQADRDRHIANFNQIGSTFGALVTSLQLNAFGVDFHHDCHIGISLERPNNTTADMQAGGRLSRVGQKNPVDFTFVYQRSSYDGWIEARNLEKYAVSLAAEANIDERIVNQQRVIVAYEIARIQFGHESSRYSRLCYDWHEMDSEKVRREGLFYSAMAEALVANPELSEKITKDNIADIAKRWVPGTPLTLDHIELRVEEQSDGIQLRESDLEKATRFGLGLAEIDEEAARNGITVHIQDQDDTGSTPRRPPHTERRLTDDITRLSARASDMDLSDHEMPDSSQLTPSKKRGGREAAIAKAKSSKL
jgi:hypothetical protein